VLAAVDVTVGLQFRLFHCIVGRCVKLFGRHVKLFALYSISIDYVFIDFRRFSVTMSTTTIGLKSIKYKCIEDDTKAAARQSLNCIKNKNR